MRVISRTPCCGQSLGFGDHGFEAARAELAAQLRNDAERAGMIAALGDLDVSRVLRRGENARRVSRRKDSWADRRPRRPTRCARSVRLARGHRLRASDAADAGLQRLAAERRVQDGEWGIASCAGRVRFRQRRECFAVRRCRRRRRLRECSSGSRCDNARRGIRRR